MANQKGIALIQVLIISTILVMLGIFISQTVREQVATAHSINTAFALRLKIESAEAKLLQALLTNQRYKKVESKNNIVQRWNFFAKEFLIDEEVTVTIQDLSSLVSLNVTEKTILTAVLKELGIEREKITNFIAALADWKDQDQQIRLNGAEKDFYRLKGEQGPRNGYLQSLSEVEYIRGGDILSFERWNSLSSIEMVSSFNPLNSPKIILKAMIKDDNIVNEVLELRASNRLKGNVFYQLTGIDQDESINYGTGKRLLVKLKAQQNNQQVTKSFVVSLKPRSQLQPMIITDTTWNTP